MKVKVEGANMEVGQSLTNHVNENLEKNVTKYFDMAVDGEVYFSKEGSDFKSVIIVNEGTKRGLVVKADATAAEVYSAFGEALNKISTQLRRYKNKIKNYRKNTSESEDVYKDGLDGMKYVIPPVKYIEEDLSLKEIQENEENFSANNLNIINEKITNIEELYVDDAIMKMDLANLPALVFINKDNKRINVVYHRQDGNISWVDPKGNN